MDHKWFVFILMVSVAATATLALWKGIGGGRNTFIGRLSWFAVPWPVFIGLVALGWPYVWAVLRYEIYKGL
jgi:hypothetical protein